MIKIKVNFNDLIQSKQDLNYYFCYLSKDLTKDYLINLIDKLDNNKVLDNKDKKMFHLINMFCFSLDNSKEKLQIQEFAKNIGLSRNKDLVGKIVYYGHYIISSE